MNWSELITVADEIISEFGQVIVIKSNVVGEYNPDTGLVPNTVTLVTAKGVLFDYGEKDINGTTILKGDKKLLVTAKNVPSITTNDTVTVDTKDYHITNVTQTNPAGTNLLWDLSLRGNS